MRHAFALLLLLSLATPSFATDFQPYILLPDEFGFGGPLAGVAGETLIVAGGANFPDGPPWSRGKQPAGAKVWHDRLWFLKPRSDTFRSGPKLPYPLAYAPCVSTPHGLFVLGGETWSAETGNVDTAEVLRIDVPDEDGPPTVTRHALPALPRASSYHGAGCIGDTIFVAASHPECDQSSTLDVASFWSLDLTAEQPHWTEHPAWPGPPRTKMAVAVARGPEGTVGTRLYLISGSTWHRDADGTHDLARYRYFDDAYAFDPEANTWHTLARLPKLHESREIDTSGYAFDAERNAWVAVDGKTPPVDIAALFDSKPRAAAAASAIGDSDRVLLVSGSTGRYVTLPVRERPAFPPEVLAYDIDEDRWSVVGSARMPVVTTALVTWNGRHWLISGEVRPGIRTPLVQTAPAAKNTD